MVRLASRPSSGPGASAPSSDEAELAPAPAALASVWLVFAPAFASGFTFGLQPATAKDAASTTANSTSDLRITFAPISPPPMRQGAFYHKRWAHPIAAVNLARRSRATASRLLSEGTPNRFPHLAL